MSIMYKSNLIVQFYLSYILQISLFLLYCGYSSLNYTLLNMNNRRQYIIIDNKEFNSVWLKDTGRREKKNKKSQPQKVFKFYINTAKWQ